MTNSILETTTPDDVPADAPLLSVPAFRKVLLRHLHHRLGTTLQSASVHDAYTALAHTVRDQLIDRYIKTTDAFFNTNPRFVYYLSAEFHLGKQLLQNMLYTGTRDVACSLFNDGAAGLDRMLEQDPEPGLANGGLGRLAACFLDSLATLNIPAVGYGIRYEYGIFRQTFVDGWQAEQPDDWLTYGFPWEFAQTDDMVDVGFYGYVERYTDAAGLQHAAWKPETVVRAEPYHILIPGFGTEMVNILRLWRARARQEFDFQLFDEGDFEAGVARQVDSETISKVLYPNDSTPKGRELRLKQQYFFVAASLRDIIRRFRIRNSDWQAFPDKVVIQLNDTHPVVAIPELMRILVDEQLMDWDQAWDITSRTFGYTSHTLLPEALETWPVDLFGRVLPRHLEIVYEINHRFLQEVRSRFPGDEARMARMSLIQESPTRSVRMAHVATVAAFAVNGVAGLQSRLLAAHTLADFAAMWPAKFTNVTNGVTPRRFLAQANPRLATLITTHIGDGWITDLEQLTRLEPLAESAEFRQAWAAVKQANKRDLASWLARTTGIAVDPDSIFDVMVKRLHEYKRQHLKALHIITLYHRLKDNPRLDLPPRTFLFGAKSAPGYRMAKLIIKLVNNVAAVVNHDPDVAGRLRVVFVPNFNVSAGEIIYPAGDISEQISLAGKEASGTGNMKLALNGAVTVGTLDGANIEIRDLVGPENFFLFGLNAADVMSLQASGYRPLDHYNGHHELHRALDGIALGAFSGGDTQVFQPLIENLLLHDPFLVLADYASYLEASETAARAYQNRDLWTRLSILNSARCGYFSSDRAIRDYCRMIWRVEPLDWTTTAS